MPPEPASTVPGWHAAHSVAEANAPPTPCCVWGAGGGKPWQAPQRAAAVAPPMPTAAGPPVQAGEGLEPPPMVAPWQ